MSLLGIRTIRATVLVLTIVLMSPQIWAATPAKKKQTTKKQTSSSKRATSTKNATLTKKVVKKTTRRRASRKRSHRPRGQQAIQTSRVREIQEALVRAEYLDGNPTGVWDSPTKAAMQKFQQDNGWQTKVLPDSRALIKLGLGPNHDGLLNPESAAVSPNELMPEKEIPGGAVVETK